MDVRIDRLRLQVSGVSPDTAGRFGRLVAERLRVLLATAPPAGGGTRVPSLRVPVSGPAGHQESLAAAVAAEVARALRAEVTR